jgi:antitoxin component YwqK of YwqJK toxin-antitoxin module
MQFTAMKWYYYIVFILALACSRNSVVVSEDDIGADVFYVKDTYRPFTGSCIVVYNDTEKVKEQFTFKNGVLNGEASAWYQNGQIRRKGYYSKGQIHGKWTFWDEQGHKIVEANYKQDSLNGTYLSLYANGRIKEKGHFARNKRTGKWVYYDERGQVMQTSAN